MRDPAAYVKRAELATPKLIDHDYNYLTSLEREIDKADRDAADRGIVLGEAARDGTAKRSHMKGEVPLRMALERCRIVVARAPSGMSRAKRNQTRWVRKKQHVVWTVEWVHPDGRKEEREFADDRAIGEVYKEAFGPKEEYRPRKRRKSAKERLRAAHKGGEPSQDDVPPEPTTKCLSEAPPKLYDLPAEPRAKEIGGPDCTRTVPSNMASKENESALTSLGQPTMGIITTPDHISTCSGKNQNGLQSESDSRNGPPSSTQPSSQFTFYLHAPSLPSRRPVLIPLHQSSTLALSLRDRLVLEYPTIYVFKADDQVPGGGSQVPSGFISEEDFFAQAKTLLVEEIEEGEIAEDKAEAEGDAGKNGTDGLGRDFDAERVLKVLGEDLKNPG